jgi:hypothetical protein
MNLDAHKKAFNSVGWFIPPYLGLRFLTRVKDAIYRTTPFDQTHLEAALAIAYSPEHLAAMVYERYPKTPYVKDYAQSIAEAIEAHHLGLGHVAVIGLMPVIEGAGRRLADSRSVKAPTMKSLFPNLALDCKNEVVKRNIGDTQELICMFESFEEFTGDYLYIRSDLYQLDDKTNRHGMLHGAYADSDFGDPINFYKAIGSIDFLCMVAALRAQMSWMAPNPTEGSQRLAHYYRTCMVFAATRPT